MEIIGLIIAAVVVYGVVKAVRTKKDFNDPLFEIKVEKKVSEYAAKHGSPPPNHMMPEIYKEARKEIDEEKS